MPATLHLHNTLGGREQPFVPLDAATGRVTFYTCGPTVYDFAHIGNFRSFLAADVLRRWLESPLCARADAQGTPTGDRGYDVVQVMNITDVGHMTDDSCADGSGDDKMALAGQRLLEQKKSGKLPDDATGIDADDPFAVARFYAHAFVVDASTLAMRVADDASTHPERMPHATDHVPHMLAMTLDLLESGSAYVACDGVVYFDTGAFPDYGNLSGNTPDAIRSGAGGRVDESTQAIKKHPADFMLWKPDPTHLMRWDPAAIFAGDTKRAAQVEKFGLHEGYPGWHIECSAMARAILGEQIDLHSGGEDNIFPHHECEIAQSRAATGCAHFARYWFHPRFLLVEGKKMSKSAGTFFTVRDLLARGFTPACVRLELIKTHYRANANFTEQGLLDSARMAERWVNFVERSGVDLNDDALRQRVLDEQGTPRAHARDAFVEAMNSDLNVAGAIGTLNIFLRDTREPTPEDGMLVLLFDTALGIVECARRTPEPTASTSGPSDEEIDALVQARQEARKNKDFAESDRIRDELAALGIEVKDSPTGPTWSRKASL